MAQIEGAVTTLAVAEKLARESRAPRTKDEQMVLNHYRAMRWILENRDRPVDRGLICELHRRITEDAFEGPPGFEGRFREGPVAVRDSTTDEVVYAAPPYEELPLYLLLLEQWANNRSESRFLHPVVSASLLHFPNRFGTPSASPDRFDQTVSAVGRRASAAVARREPACRL